MATRETVDELHKDQSRRLIHILQRLPFGYYKRDHPGSEVQPGHLLHPGDYQALLLTLEHLSKPDRKGRRRLTASARLRKFQEDRNEFDKQ
jgi:hypothetical protein